MTDPILLYLVEVYKYAIMIMGFMLLVEVGARPIVRAFSKGELSIF